jgi:hypothetical protein
MGEELANLSDCWRQIAALEIAMYAPVNPFVAISHLVFSGIASIVSAIETFPSRGYFFPLCPSFLRVRIYHKTDLRSRWGLLRGHVSVVTREREAYDAPDQEVEIGIIRFRLERPSVTNI